MGGLSFPSAFWLLGSPLYAQPDVAVHLKGEKSEKGASAAGAAEARAAAAAPPNGLPVAEGASSKAAPARWVPQAAALP